MPDEGNLSESIQDYLKTIYQLSPEGQSTSTNQIAERLNVRAASVTGMLKRLSAMEPPLIDYHKHHGARLTEEGRHVSLQIIRKHRLLELFLVETLGYTWDEVHEEAEHLEHAISFRFGERLARLLGEPDFDPHGDPIPSQDLKLPEMKTVPLSGALAGQHAVIRRVPTSNPALLRYLGEMGLQPGMNIFIIAQIPFDQTVRIRVEPDNCEHVLGSEISMLLQVEII